MIRETVTYSWWLLQQWQFLKKLTMGKYWHSITAVNFHTHLLLCLWNLASSCLCIHVLSLRSCLFVHCPTCVSICLIYNTRSCVLISTFQNLYFVPTSHFKHWWLHLPFSDQCCVSTRTFYLLDAMSKPWLISGCNVSWILLPIQYSSVYFIVYHASMFASNFNILKCCISR